MLAKNTLLQFECANFELCHFQEKKSPKRPSSANMTLAPECTRITLRTYKSMLYESLKWRFSFILMHLGPAEVDFWRNLALTKFSKICHFLTFLTTLTARFTGLKTIGFHFWDYQPTSIDSPDPGKIRSFNLNVQILSYVIFKKKNRQNVRHLPAWH